MQNIMRLHMEMARLICDDEGIGVDVDKVDLSEAG